MEMITKRVATGYGSSAIVYVAKYKPLQKLVGVKQIELDRFESNQIEELRVSCLPLLARQDM